MSNLSGGAAALVAVLLVAGAAAALRAGVVSQEAVVSETSAAPEAVHGPPPDAVAPRPTLVSPGDRYTGPTLDLTRLGNSLDLYHRSFTTLVVARPGVVLSRPVDISVVYVSPMAVPQEILQSYVVSTGNRFLLNDVVSDGSRRRMTFAITLSERQTNGGRIEDTFYWQVDLDPLYDVAVGPLRFKLLDDCDWVGDSEIRLRMQRPDGTTASESFSLSAGEERNVNAFAWSRSEAGASPDLREPYAQFMESDVGWNPAGSPTFLARDTPPLIPGETRVVRVVEVEESADECEAEVSYTLRHTPRYYYDLGP